MVTHQQLRYRSLQQLIDTCSVDLRAIYSDGVIETAELIKVAQRCNYELGLQINQTKETILDIDHHRSKLPADFQFLNFALLCHHHTVVSEVWPEGLVTEEKILEPWFSPTQNLTSCPCWTVSVTSGTANLKVIDCYGVTTSRLFTSGVTKVCANIVDNSNHIPNVTAVTNSFCYNDPNNGQYTCTPVVNCQCSTPNVFCGTQPNPDPNNQNRVRTICNGQVGIAIEQTCGKQVMRYERFEPLYMQPARRASGFSSNEKFRLHGNIGMLRDNYLETGQDCCKVYLNYQGLLEDDDGNLLVLDHPLINEYYEWEVKKRIIQNLYLNGEPDLERRYQLAEKEAMIARHKALDIAYMPDFQLLKQTFQRERQIMNEEHFAPFSRFYGQFGISSWLDQLANGRYRE